MIRWLDRIRKRSIHNSKIAWWEMEADRLMNLCRDTGGESSPYFEKMKEHMNRHPDNVVN